MSTVIIPVLNLHSLKIVKEVMAFPTSKQKGEKKKMLLKEYVIVTLQALKNF